jgi:PAS domain S-box-containing protein
MLGEGGGSKDEILGAIAKLVIENASEFAIITLDGTGRIVTWNPGAHRIFGYAAHEIVGQPLSRLFSETDITAGVDQRELALARTTGKAEDSRWHVRKDGGRFWGNGVLMRIEGQTPAFLKILRDETRQRLAEEQRALLLNELNHRIKNTLATVQSIAEQTLRASNVDTQVRANLTDRLMALSGAHDVLVKENWAGADVEDIVERTLAPHQQDGRQFVIDGPIVRASPQQALSLSLALHELTTNALKYGALSVAGGSVSVTWNMALDGEGRRHMTLVWKERGGPPVAWPERTGFGMRLITRHFVRESGGAARVDFQPDGLQCLIELTLSDAERALMLDLKASGAGSAG